MLYEKQQETLKNLKSFAAKASIHANLPIVEELQAIHETLRAVAEKEYPQFPEIPEPLPFPEILKTDLTETNDLLKKLVEKKHEPVEIEVKLDLT